MKRVAIFCTLITILGLGGLATLIAWLADPMSVPAFVVDKATVTGYNYASSNHNLSATFNLSISVHNRDHKYTIKYHLVVVSVYHNGYTLAYHAIDPFIHHPHDKTTFLARPAAHNVAVTNADVADDLKNSGRVGQLAVDVRVRAAVKYQVVRWKHRNYIMDVICSPVIINLGSGNKFKRKTCDVSAQKF